MKQLPHSQAMFIHALIKQAFQSAAVSISIEDKMRNVLLTISNLESPLQLVKESSGQRTLIHQEEAIHQLQSTFAESEGFLLIERESSILRVGIQGTKIIQETLDRNERVALHPAWAIGKATHLDPHQAAPLLKAIGLMTSEGEIKAPMRKKFKQVNHFLELIQSMLPKESGKKSFTIVDCGCGKSYLSFVLCWYMEKVMKMACRFYGIDVSQDRIAQCRATADTLALKAIHFQCITNRDAKLPQRPDLLISLHACDTATDEAIALGVLKEARQLAVVPCCQHELAGQIDQLPMYPLKKHGIFKQRYADLLTDMTRCLFLESHGYMVTVGEFVSVEETPKNLMIRAKKGNPQQKQRQKEYEAFKEYYHIRPSIDFMIMEMTR